MESGNYDFKTLLDLIETSKKYQNTRKRSRSEKGLNYNYDMEQLVKCLPSLEKLNNLIGMDDIKKNIIDQVLFYAQELNTNEMMHIVITGSPGTGKTTIGKILAELYCSLGFLKTNHFKVVGREDLIGGYLGQTAIKTKKLLTSSLGGVLMIDEAYSLGSRDDSYSKECLDTITQFLSENTSNFLMIICGYKKEIDSCFFGLNPGLRRRFPWNYNIDNYNSKDIKSIFMYQVKENGWKLDKNFDIDNFNFNMVFENNGGDTLSLFDKSKICHGRRVFGKSKKIKKILNLEDINTALSLLKKSKDQVKEKDQVPYGMYV